MLLFCLEMLRAAGVSHTHDFVGRRSDLWMKEGENEIQSGYIYDFRIIQCAMCPAARPLVVQSLRSVSDRAARFALAA